MTQIKLKKIPQKTQNMIHVLFITKVIDLIGSEKTRQLLLESKQEVLSEQKK